MENKNITEFCELYCDNYYIQKNKIYADRVNLDNRGIDTIPFKFGRVKGSFSCNNNKLISLKNSPYSVYSDFECSNNLISDLRFSPVIVRGLFDISMNMIKDFSNHRIKNKLIALKAAKNYIEDITNIPDGVFLDLSFNRIKDVSELENKTFLEIDLSYNLLENFKGLSGKILNSLNISNNKDFDFQKFPVPLLKQLLMDVNQFRDFLQLYDNINFDLIIDNTIKIKSKEYNDNRSFYLEKII